jgi:hypothetical protein
MRYAKGLPAWGKRQLGRHFPQLLDSTSLFLTGNTDTVYYLACLDLTKGPMVVEQPPKGVGTINDMWFQ